MTMLALADRRIRLFSGAIALAGVTAFIAVALVAMLVAGGGDTTYPSAPYLSAIFRFTAIQAYLSTLISVLLAMPVALSLARRPLMRGRGPILQLMALPLGLPAIASAFAILEIWGRNGVANRLLIELGLIDKPVSIYGLTGILIAHVFFNLPLAARLMLQALERVPGENWQLASSLGLSRLSLFRFVEWPALSAVIPGIAMLIFMLCATSFTLVLTLGGGPQATTLEVAIYQALKFDYDPPRAVLLAGLQILLSVAALIAVSRFGAPEDQNHPAIRRLRRLDGASLGSKLSDSLTITLFLLFMASPILMIFIAGLSTGLGAIMTSPSFLQALVTSLAVASTAGLTASVLTIAIIESRYAAPGSGPRRRLSQSILGLAALVPSMSLLVPSLALATGWFFLLHAIGWAENGGPVIVILINTLMAMPFTLRVLGPAFSAHHRAHDRLAASLGISGLARAKILDWPLLRRAIIAAFTFAMALSLGDLGAIAVFGSDNFITLPALLHAKLGSYRSTEAAGIALILATLALLLAMPAARLDRVEGQVS